jgi:hypothetical protein
MELTGTEWVTVFIAVLALLLAIYASVSAQRAKSASERLAARTMQLEAMLEANRTAELTSAQLVPTLERSFGPSGRVLHRVHIENIGRGTAKAVRVRIGGQALVRSGADGPSEEVGEIPPGVSISYPIDTDPAAVDENVRIELNWIDAAGRQQTSRASLRRG